MKQLAKVISIISNGEKTAVVRNKNGKFELPQSELKFNEQPEQALCRVISSTFREASTYVPKLLDVISYRSRDENVIFIIYKIDLTDVKVSLLSSQDKYTECELIDSVDSRIEDASGFVLSIFRQEGVNRTNSLGDTGGHLQLFCDGASRGNPGVSAAGFVIIKDGEVVRSSGEFLGITSSSQAEYHSLKIGLQTALELGINSIIVFMDSLMVIGQMNGLYKVKNRELWPIYDHIKKLSGQFSYIQFKHIPREENRLADSQANQILDTSLKDSDSML